MITCRTCRKPVVYETRTDPGYLPRTGWSDQAPRDAFVCFSADAYTHTPVYAGTPHPDYPGMVWSAPGIETDVLRVIETAPDVPHAVAEIMGVLNRAGYDSMDREMAFWIATQIKGWDYDDLYTTWLDDARS